MADFRGKTYLYPSPIDGLQEIGVFNAPYAYNMYTIGYYKATGARARVIAAGITFNGDANAVQQALDKFAQERGLKEVQL